jgi:hypothetical protein
MRVDYGQIVGGPDCPDGGTWQVRMTAPNVKGGSRTFASTSEAQARALAVQLAGGRRDRVRGPHRWPRPSPAPAPKASIVDATPAVDVDAVNALLGQSARKVVVELVGGQWDDVLEIVKGVEVGRDGGGRKTVLAAIAKRRPRARRWR